MRLVQLHHPQHGRRVAMPVNDQTLRLVREVPSTYDLVQAALAAGSTLNAFVRAQVGAESLDYDAVHSGRSDWKLRPPLDHPEEPARCLVTGTGLTHKASAENRQAMHEPGKAETLSDSMRMYRSGLAGGRPGPGEIGAVPEWFYKGCGTILRAHGEPLEVPPFALDGGEEAEVAGAYVVDESGSPRRVGFVLANEFSDHRFEKENYLYLAHSKLRTCSIGPELIVGEPFENARGIVRLRRNGEVYWSKPFATGERNMSHTIANLEHHHFKYAAHRRPGDVHIHFFGADTFSFGDGIELLDGDEMEIELAGMGRALRNPVRVDRSKQNLVRADSI